MIAHPSAAWCRLAPARPATGMGRFRAGLSLSTLLAATGLALLVLLALRLAPFLAAPGRETPAAFPGPVAAGKPPVTATAVEPAAGPPGDAGTSPADSRAGAALVDPATLGQLQAELDRGRAALAARERDLALREAALELVREHLDAQLGRLDALKTDVAQLLAELSAADETRAKQLARVYEGMKARNAASIFEEMEPELVLPILRLMREAKLAAVVAAMAPEKARALTAALAERPPTPSLR